MLLPGTIIAYRHSFEPIQTVRRPSLFVRSCTADQFRAFLLECMKRDGKSYVRLRFAALPVSTSICLKKWNWLKSIDRCSTAEDREKPSVVLSVDSGG